MKAVSGKQFVRLLERHGGHGAESMEATISSPNPGRLRGFLFRYTVTSH